MHRVGKQFVSIVAGLSLAGLASAQTSQTQTSPGTVPVPKASSQPGFNSPGFGDTLDGRAGEAHGRGDEARLEEARDHLEHEAVRGAYRARANQ